MPSQQPHSPWHRQPVTWCWSCYSCLVLAGVVNLNPNMSPLTIEYTSSQIDSAGANLEVFTKHVREYMTSQGEWEVRRQPVTQPTLSQHLTTLKPKNLVLEVPITQTIASLLTTIFEHMDDLKGLSVNNVLRMWPSHCHQFGNFVTKLSDRDGKCFRSLIPSPCTARSMLYPGRRLSYPQLRRRSTRARSPSKMAPSLKPTPKQSTGWSSMRRSTSRWPSHKWRKPRML